jgi:DNA polymerase elongation subunit (family B)
MRWIILDIETAAPEISDAEVARYFANRKSELLLEVHPLFSKVIDIGVMWDGGVEHFAGDNEDENLSDFWDFFEEKEFAEDLSRDRYSNYLGKRTPIQLVTFNGDDFDIPFLLFRSSLWKIEPSVDIETYPYRGMKKSNHFDCLRFISGGEPKKKVSLEIACRVLGINVPEFKMPEGRIRTFYRDNNWDQIKQKNELDLTLTHNLYLKLIGENP